MAEQLRCHRCSYWIGEAERPVTLIGLFKGPEQGAAGDPRRSYLCRHCGWVNVFREVVAPAPSAA